MAKWHYGSVLIGRETELEALLASKTPLFLLTGDSGAGKSELLSEAQSRDASIAPPPVRLSNAPAALQTAFLTALSDAVALAAAKEGTIQRLGGLVVQAAQRLAAAQAKDLAKGVGRQVLGLVRAKLSDEAAEAIKNMMEALATTADEQLDQRIRNASAPDVIETLKALAIEVAAVAGEGGIVLAFDRLELLQLDDARRLADLAESAPAGVRFRGAVAVTDGVSRSLVEQLQLAGATEFELGGLDRGAIRDWLRYEGVDERHADDVLRVTQGMCMSISDAIALLKSGEDIRALSAPQALAIRTRQAWRAVSTDARAAAARLTEFDNPLDAADCAAFLGMPIEDWAVLVAELRDARIFVDRPFPWFHELRRKVIVSDILSLAELRQNRVAGAKALAELIMSHPRPRAQLLVQYASLLSTMGAEHLDDPELRSLAGVTDEGLAVLCALIELTDGDTSLFEASHVLDHAQHFLPKVTNPADLLRDLEATGLIFLEEGPDAAVIGARWTSTNTGMYVFGLAASRFGKLPRARLASYVFRLVLEPLLNGFRTAEFGIGEPPIHHLNRRAAESQMRPPGSSVVYPGRYGPNVVGWHEYAGVRMYASITFDDVALRDQALAPLQQLHQVLDDAAVSAVHFVAMPIEKVAPRRYVRAVEKLLNVQIFGTTAPKRPRAKPEAALLERLQTRSALWQTASEFDRMAYNLKRPGGAGFYESGDLSLTVEIVDGHGVTEIAAMPTGGVFAPFARYELERLLGLSPQQHIGQVSMHYGKARDEETPVVAEVMRAASEARKLNRFMNEKVLLYDETAIQAALDEAETLLRKDCGAIASALGLAKVGPTVDHYLILQEPTPSPGWVAGATEAAYVVRTAGTGRSFVRVLSTSELAPFSNSAVTIAGDVDLQQAMRRLFPDSSDELRGVSLTNPDHAVPSALGHDDDSLRLRYPASLGG